MSTPRIVAPNLFAGLAPPWILANLDANSSAVQGVLNDASLGYVNFAAVDTGTANAYSVTLPIGVPSAYRVGMNVTFTAANSNSGASTITVAPLGAVSIINAVGGSLQAGDILAGGTYTLIYNGTQFILLGAGIGATGQFSVTPGAGMNVAINQIGPFLQTAAGIINGSVMPSNLLLVAPGANSYYATVYWDATANVYGAVYSTPSATPVLGQVILPDPSWQIPLAAVLIPAGAITISSANITDLRKLTFRPYNINLGNTAGISAINCSGASRVSILASATASITFFLNNFQYGVPLQIWVINISAGAITVKVTATSPGGVVIPTRGKVAGVQTLAVDLAAIGFNANVGTVWSILSMGSIAGNALVCSLC